MSTTVRYRNTSTHSEEEPVFMEQDRYYVLVLDGQWKQVLSITRSLGRKGIEVLVGDSSKIALTKFSKYCAEAITYPDPLRYPDEFIEFLLHLVQQRRIDLIIPASEITVELLSIHKSKFEEFTKIPLADYEIVVQALDKSLTFRTAIELGIPCPKTYFVEDVSQISPLADRIEYPVIIKPRRATSALGYKEVFSKDDFLKQYWTVHKSFRFPIVQEFIPDGGGKYSFSAIFDARGDVKASFVHEYLRQFPYHAGVGTYARSVKNDSVLNYGIQLLKALNWYGVAEVEFKMDPRDHLPKLLEINPRFWGMCEMAVSSGMDLPCHLFKMVVQNDRTNYTEYRCGQYLRWLLPGEVLHFISNPNRGKISKDFFNFFDKNTKYYIISKDDPLPILGVMILSFLGIFINKEIYLLMKQLFNSFFEKFTFTK